MGIDILLFAGSLYVAHIVRFDFNIPQQNLRLFYWMLPFILVTKTVSFLYFDLYRGMWRFTSIADLLNIIKASSISTLMIICFILFSSYRFVEFPRSVFIIDWCLTILFISGFRLSIRIYFVHLSDNASWLGAVQVFCDLLTRKITAKKNLLIIGAGNCGEKIYREIRDNSTLQYNVVGFLDDDPKKVGMKIHGVPVLGRTKDIDTAAKKMGANEILIAIPSANSQQMRHIVEHVKNAGLPLKPFLEWVNSLTGK